MSQAEIKSTEQLFCGNPKPGSALLAVREGRNAREVLEQAVCIVDAARRALEELAIGTNGEEHQPTGTMWSLSYNLDTATALVNSVIGGLARAKS
jgi:hypothetical protein